MIFGIGTDIVEIDRMQRSLGKGDEFKRLVYSKAEIEYCESQGNSIASFAGRFAAKEAFLKALGTGWVGEMKLYEIAVINDKEGKPSFNISGEVQEVYETKKVTNLHLSISHSKNYATAVVVIEK